MQVLSRSSLIYQLAIGVIVAIGAAVVGSSIVGYGWLAGAGVLAFSFWIALRKPLRRRRAVQRKAPELKAALDRFWPWIGLVDRGPFERDVRIVLEEWTFEGVEGVDVTLDMKVGVAAGAALLLHGRPEWELPSRQTVIFYPDRFDADYVSEESGAFDGMAHQQGPIILSSKAIEESWADPYDGSNVVLHELAHLLDYENEFADGVPSLVDPGSTVAWRELVRKETKRVRLGRSMLRRYAAKNAAEFFAVAVENFFERPDVMEERHPELYAALEALFNLDPRRWKAETV